MEMNCQTILQITKQFKYSQNSKLIKPKRLNQNSGCLQLQDKAIYQQDNFYYIVLDIGYYSQKCKGCPPTDCLYNSNNKYCLIDLINFQPQVGRFIIEQQFKEYAIFKYDRNLWLSYMDQFDNEFINWQNAQATSESVIKKLKINSNVVKSLRYQFNETDLLKNWRDQIVKSNIEGIPDVVINSINYEGNADAADIAQMICASLQQLPSACSQFFQINSQLTKPQSKSWMKIILSICLSIFVVVLIGVIISIVYKKLIKKEITNEMSSKVKQQVSKYISLIEDQQQKNKSKNLEISKEQL